MWCFAEVELIQTWTPEEFAKLPKDIQRDFMARWEYHERESELVGFDPDGRLETRGERMSDSRALPCW